MASRTQTDRHTHASCNAVTLVWGSLRLAPIIHEHLLPSVNNIKPMTSMANIPLWNENIVIFFTKRLKMLCFTVDREQHGTKTSCV